MKNFILPFLLLLSAFKVQAQSVFHTEDIANFYQAFDSVHSTQNREKQIEFVQKIYLDNGSLGIEYAIKNSVEGRDATANDWVEAMVNNKQNYIRIRPYFKNLSSQTKILENKFIYFKEQYSHFKDGSVYFIIGLGMFGGRPEKNNIFIGCEINANENPDWAVNMVLHEFVHTLQYKSNNALLAHCLNEGACDFIAETINQKSLTDTYPNGYIDFGLKNETIIWNEFKKYIASNVKGEFFNWLYGTKGRNINGRQINDLGYFMGYQFCKSYYKNAIDKKQAIKDIIEMDVSTDEKAKAFLLQSNYVPKKDLKFIKKLKFTRIFDTDKKLKLIQYGYKIEKENVVFKFKLPKNINPNEVQFITIAGTFNGWNPKDLNYQMKKLENNNYEYRMSLNLLNEKNHEFKFVINGKNWQSAPENAKNFNNGNLTLSILKI